jgi:hypothetical protein
MKRTLAATLTAIALVGVIMPTYAATVKEEREKIERVVETFRVSLIKKDPVTFMTLFLKPDIPWIGVTTDKSLALVIAEKTDPKMPEPEKVRTEDNPKAFIEWIAQSKDPVEEKFKNVRIDTDGDVAQVWFDYTFNSAGYMENWGKEAWHMVKTKYGWKISSVIYSVEYNPVPPPERGVKP